MIKSEDLRLGQPRVLETDNNLILPVNKWIRLLITGVNVIHSFGLHFLILAAITINDINILAITLLLFAISAAETAIGISLLITFKNKINNSMHKIRS